MAQPQAQFQAGCWPYVTARDLIENLPVELRCDHHLGRLPTDMGLAKIIWTTEACEYLHAYNPDDDFSIYTNSSTCTTETDSDVVLLDVEGRDFIRPHLFFEEATMETEEMDAQGQSGPGLEPHPAVGPGSLEHNHGDTKEIEANRWPTVQQPRGTGVLPDERMIPAGMEEEEDDEVFSFGTVVKYM